MITTEAFRAALQRYTNLNLIGAPDDILYKLSGYMRVMQIDKDDRGAIDGWRRQYERAHPDEKN
jgi:hypothetical protein